MHGRSTSDVQDSCALETCVQCEVMRHDGAHDLPGMHHDIVVIINLLLQSDDPVS